MSQRPWDNGYNSPQQLGDTFESHPYHFSNPKFKFENLATASPVPQGSLAHNDGSHAVVINEYGYVWLNRDGTPTTLTKRLYQNVLGPSSTTAQRFHLQATYIAAETEFWRAHRKAAAVMYFTALGYSRDDGQTSDNWLKGGVAKLIWEPEFLKYVRDAFAPVGLMIDFWKGTASRGTHAPLAVVLINDLAQPWNGPVALRAVHDGKVLMETTRNATVDSFGTATLAFDFTWPEQSGPCVL